MCGFTKQVGGGLQETKPSQEAQRSRRWQDGGHMGRNVSLTLRASRGPGWSGGPAPTVLRERLRFRRTTYRRLLWRCLCTAHSLFTAGLEPSQGGLRAPTTGCWELGPGLRETEPGGRAEGVSLGPWGWVTSHETLGIHSWARPMGWLVGLAASTGQDGRAARVMGSLQMRKAGGGPGAPQTAFVPELAGSRGLTRMARILQRSRWGGGGCPSNLDSPADCQEKGERACGTVHVRTTVSRKSRDRDSGAVCTRDPVYLSCHRRPTPDPAEAPHNPQPPMWPAEGAGAAHRPHAPNTHIYTPQMHTYLCIYTRAPQMNIYTPIPTTYTCLKCT